MQCVKLEQLCWCSIVPLSESQIKLAISVLAEATPDMNALKARARANF